MGKSGSLGIWSKPAQNADSHIEAHFNYWHICGDEQFRSSNSKLRDFIEIGILVEDINLVEEVKVFIPLTLCVQDIEDCAHHFSDINIAQGIFNEVLKVSTHGAPGPKFVQLSDGGGAMFARVHEFTKDQEGLVLSQDLAISHMGDGTVLTLSSIIIGEAKRAATNGGSSYFRLRVFMPNSKLNPFIRSVPTSDKHLRSSYDEIEYLDFRVNEARTLPAAIDQLMRRDQNLAITKITLIAFLAAIPVSSEITVSNAESHKKRLLEHQLWKDYVSGGIPTGMMVYHWKRGVSLAQAFGSGTASSAIQNVSDFTAFVKLNTRRMSLGLWAFYLAIAFAVGLMGNLLATAITSNLFAASSSKGACTAAGAPQKPVAKSGTGQSADQHSNNSQ